MKNKKIEIEYFKKKKTFLFLVEPIINEVKKNTVQIVNFDLDIKNITKQVCDRRGDVIGNEFTGESYINIKIELYRKQK